MREFNYDEAQEEVFNRLADCFKRGLKLNVYRVQALIEEFYANIKRERGDCPMGLLKDIVSHYSADSALREGLEYRAPGLADYFANAAAYYCSKREGQE